MRFAHRSVSEYLPLLASMQTLTAIVTILALAVSSPTVQFESELWPGEGIPVLVAGARQLSLRREPPASAPANRRLAVPIGGRVQYDQTRYQTVRSGLVIAQTAMTLSGRNLGSLTYLAKDDYYSDKFPTQSYDLQAGSKIEFLQYRAEGNCFMRLGNNVIEVYECPDLSDPRFRPLNKAEVLWWVRVTIGGKPRGWALVDGRALRESTREF